MMLLKQLFLNKRYRWTTLLVILACGLMIRLGFWQLDRLAQRETLNAEIKQRVAAPSVVLNKTSAVNDLEGLKFRSARVRGVFDHSQEVALQGQPWQGQPGVHLITPLIIEGSDRAVLVDRGWIPAGAAAPEKWGHFATSGTVDITGMIQLSQPRPNASPWQKPELAIFRLDIERLQHQVSPPLLPFFIVQAPEPGQTSLPYRGKPDLNLSNGPHLGYAIQWFAFTLMLAVGYVGFIRRQMQPAHLAQVAPLSMEAPCSPHPR